MDAENGSLQERPIDAQNTSLMQIAGPVIRWVLVPIAGFLAGWYAVVPAFRMDSPTGVVVSAGAVLVACIAGAFFSRLRWLRPTLALAALGCLLASSLFLQMGMDGLLPN